MPPVLQHRNNQIYIDLGPLLEAELEETFLTAEVAAAGVSLTVKDIDGFAINQILVIGELGEETCEIVKTHASSAPSGTTITLVAGGVEFAHPSGTRVRRIQYNQIEISHSATESGSKSVLVTADIQTDQLKQVYTDLTQTTGYYFARFKDAIASTFSSYSDAIAYGGWERHKAGAMMDQALRDNETTLSNIISREDCYQFLTEGIELLLGKQRSFPKQAELNYVAGQTSRGINSVTLPATIYDNTGNQSIQAIRIKNATLTYVEPDRFSEYMRDVSQTQVRTQASASDTTLEIDNSYDFEDSGTVIVYVSGTRYSITYTGVTRSATAGVLTGIPASGDGSITVTIPVDTNVWQGEVEGEPEIYTVRNGLLEFYPLADAESDNANIEMDFWTVATAINSEGDVIDVARYGMLLNYLRWRIRMKIKNAGALDFSDGYYMTFKEQLNDHIRTYKPTFNGRMAPKINTMGRRRSSSKPNIQDLTIDEQ